MDQSETTAPAADLSCKNSGSSPAVYVRGQKRKVSESFVVCFVFCICVKQTLVSLILGGL